jgi:O-antigen ligase
MAILGRRDFNVTNNATLTNPALAPTTTWITRLPLQFASFLLAVYLVASQLNPCDSVVSVGQGDSVLLIVLAMGIGFLVAMDGLLSGTQDGLRPTLLGWFAIASCGFGAWLWFCTSLQDGRGNLRHAYNGCWQWIAELILLISIAQLCRKAALSSTLIALMTACGAGTVAYALYQYFVSMPMDRRAFANNPNKALMELGITPGSTDAILYTMRIESTEPIGPFALTNSMAGFLAVWLVLASIITLAWWVRGLRASNDTASKDSSTQASRLLGSRLLSQCRMVLGVPLCFCLFITLLLTKSRTAWLATLLGVMVTCVLHPRLRKAGVQWIQKHWVVMCAGMLIVALGLGGMLMRDADLIGTAGKSLAYRFDYWQGAASLIEEQPVIGYGPNNFQSNYNHIKKATASESPADPHNFLLESGVAGGWPLMAILIAMFLIIGRLTWSLSKRNEDQDECEAGWWRHEQSIAMRLGGLLAMLGFVMFHLLLNFDHQFYSVALFALVGVSVFAAILFCRWSDSGQGTAIACVLCAITLLVHLLASGGWMLPGVMNSFCVLMGIALGSISGSDRVPESTTIARNSPADLIWRLGGLAVVLVAALTFFRSTCFPVLRVADRMNLIQANLMHSRDAESWLGLMELDAFDPELPRQIANHCIRKLEDRRQPLSGTEIKKWLNAFDVSSQEYLRREPRNWMSWNECGKWNTILAEWDRDLQNSEVNPERKSRAVECFLKAKEFYPNSIPMQLQWAVIAAWDGKPDEAKTALERVLEIEQQTTHMDRKLAASLVFVVSDMEKSLGRMEAGTRLSQEPRMARGEPVVRWLRTVLP